MQQKLLQLLRDLVGMPSKGELAQHVHSWLNSEQYCYSLTLTSKASNDQIGTEVND